MSNEKQQISTTMEEEEPLSPMARVFESPDIEYCSVFKIGFKTKIKPEVVCDALKHNVYKHPRFSSKLSDDGANWIKTKVNVKDHVVVPNIDADEIGEDGEGFVDDYFSSLSMISFNKSKPLWEIHILNVKTLDAEAVAIIRLHHSLGDGASLYSLLLACTHKTTDSNSVTIPSVKRRNKHKNEGWFLRLILTIGSKTRFIWNTIVDLLSLLAIILFLKDTETPLKGGTNTRNNRKRFYHRTVSLEDIKVIKNAMNMTINDVLVGITQASLSTYLNQRYEIKKDKNGALLSCPNNLPNGIRFHSGCTINLRSDTVIKPLADMMVKDSKCRWGNYFSFIFLPFTIGLQTDPLDYLKLSKSMMDRKKHSGYASMVYFLIKIGHKVIGSKLTGKIFNRAVMNTTTCISNVMGPSEEISFYDHPIAYIAPSVYGQSQALLMHFQSYAEKMIIVLAVDTTVIPDPQKICDGMEDSLKAMKIALWERGLL